MNIFLRYRKETVAVTVAVVLLVLIFMLGRSSGTPTDQSTDTSNKPNEIVAIATSTASSTASSTSTKPATPSLSYTQAVNKYKDSRIQFDANCVMSPNPISLRNGTIVMLDNRSANIRPVYFDRTKYNVPAFGYKLVTLRFSPLPHTVTVDCGTGRNTGIINVQ